MNQIPFPGKLFFDLGDSFLTGCSMGGAWYFLKGAYFSAPKHRLKSGIQLIRQRATELGGSFATWSLFYSLSHYATVFIRKKEDPLNGLIAGFSTGFLLSIRSGFRNALKSGFTGGVALSAIEGIVFLANNHQKKNQIINENNILNLYKREYEKKGVKFIDSKI